MNSEDFAKAITDGHIFWIYYAQQSIREDARGKKVFIIGIPDSRWPHYAGVFMPNIDWNDETALSADTFVRRMMERKHHGVAYFGVNDSLASKAGDFNSLDAPKPERFNDFQGYERYNRALIERANNLFLKPDCPRMDISPMLL